jgi:hypothetical protein
MIGNATSWFTLPGEKEGMIAPKHGTRNATGNTHMKPLCIELFAGLHGWGIGAANEGFKVVGFDIVDMCSQIGVPHPEGDIHLVIQDVLTLHGRQFKDASLIVASPPCQQFSYFAMPWSRAKAIAAEYRSGNRDVKKLTALFDACFRIQREAIEAAGHFIPMVIENVRGAQPWVGRAKWFYGSFGLWGDVPALMPITGGHRFHQECVEGFKTAGMNWSDRTKHGQDFTRIAGRQAGVKAGHWFGDGGSYSPMAMMVSKRSARKAASAMIARIPQPLARWIAKVYFPKSDVGKLPESALPHGSEPA